MSLADSWTFFKEYRKDPLGKITRLLDENNGQCTVNVFGKNLLITARAEDVNYVLKENASNYLKGRTTQKLQVLLGQGLITAEGDTWKKQHKLIRPLMNTKGIIGLLPKMSEVIEYHFKNPPQTSQINASKEMTLLTWRIVLNTLFSVRPDQQQDMKFLDGILDVMEAVTSRTRSVLPLPFWVPTEKNRKMKQIMQGFDQFVYELIKKRRSSQEMPNDLLSLLLNARDEQNQMSDKQIRDEMITFLMAGHETVANSMTWLMILLAQNPEYFQKLRQEQTATQHIESYEERVGKMPLHKAMVDESQRLYPPVWIFMRESIAEDVVSSVSIKKKTNVVVVPYATHRMKEYWENPEKFYPERFIGAPKQKPGSYYPFGLGPRACIGFNFATFEAVMILEHITKNFRWSISRPEAQESNAGITLRPTTNIEMKLDRV